jgi:hypothetical protein
LPGPDQYQFLPIGSVIVLSSSQSCRAGFFHKFFIS